MRLRKLYIKNYDVTVYNPDGTTRTEQYNIKDSIANLLLNPQLGLNGKELLISFSVTQKINQCPEDFVLLENTDYNKILGAIDQLKGLGKNDVELVRRIYECEDVEIEEKK